MTRRLLRSAQAFLQFKLDISHLHIPKTLDDF
jgi:hypothetical protein